MARVIFYWLILCCTAAWVQASPSNRPDRHINPDPGDPVPPDKQTRSFKTLDTQPLFAFQERPFFTEQYARPASIQEEDTRAKIEATYEKIFRENRFIDFLDEGALLDLPVGIKTDLGVLTYTILVDSVVMTPTESFLYASMLFEVPQSGKKIHFLGADIKFSKNGGLTGDGKLLLVGDYAMNLNGNNSQFIIKGSENKTFVEFDCNGYKQLSLDASLTFSRNLLEPEGPDGEVAPTGNVAVDFTTTVVDWSDILVSVNMSPFRVKGVNGVTFSISEAVLDFSDNRNPASIQFPEGYRSRSPLIVEGNMNLWRGVFIRNLTVTLPPQFEKTEPENPAPQGKSPRVSFTGSNLILDNVGFSGKVSANNLIPIDKGKIGNWNFSLETIYIDVDANEISSAGFNGKVNIPLSTPVKEGATADDGKLFTYTAIIKPGNEYNFTVRNSDNLNFDLWKADVTINPSSYVEIKLVDGQFRPKAHLNGQMTMTLGLKDDGVATADKNKNVKLAKVTFQGLEVQTIKPYVKVGSFSLGAEGGDSGMGGFPIQVNGISASTSGNTITLGIDLTLALVGESSGGFAANGKFNIVAESLENGRDLAYRFKKIEVERFGIDLDKGPFKFKGTLNFYKEDAVYGNGISGTVEATFEPKLKLAASAIFGTKNGFRYWFVDALVEIPGGVPIFPAVAFYSFGGGAFYKMKLDTEGVGSPLGKTASGFVYVPDETLGFGFKATMSMGVQPGKQAFNAEATYEMAFNAGGGVRYINFRGNGYFMTPPIPASVAKLQEKAKKLAEVSEKANGRNLNEGNGSEAAAAEVHGSPGEAGEKAQVWASTMIHYDFDNRTLHGNLRAYVNVAGGLIKGGGPGGMAGEAVLHFGPGEWYIYIGRPEYENRFAIEVLGLARLDAYFVIGSVIPDSPPPPDNVSEILGGVDLDYMKDLNGLADGAGVGFGASFRVDTGDITFLIFYGRFAAGLGFDIMLKDYGDVRCKGGGKLGINGWYANGQAYAYFEGTIGIRVKIWRKTKKIDILDIGAAVVAQAKLPNPTWVRGIAGGRFSVLGGLVKGKCKFEIELGKECEIIRDPGGSVLESVEVLSQLTPEGNAVDVDVFTVPQAVFNYEMEKVYEMVDPVDERIVKFKISLDAFTLKQGTTAVQTDMVWNDDNTVAALNPFDILPSETEMQVDAVVSFKEIKNGVWVTTVVDGETLKKTYTSKFKTGKAPDYIPTSNIAFTYPTRDQLNYYKDEYNEGYISLKQGQPYLFGDTEWNQVIRFTPVSGGPAVEMPYSYIPSAKEVRTTLPQNLVNDKIYKLELVNVPKGYLSSIDTNVDTTRSQVLASESADVAMRSRSAEGTLEEHQEKVIYSSYFRTSQYNTFRDKVVSVQPSSGWRSPIYPGVHMIGSNIMGPEPFSKEEIVGTDTYAPLVQIESDLSNVSWYNNEVYPLVYADYPINGALRIRPTNRDPELYGVVPTRSVFLYQVPYDYVLTEQTVSTGVMSWGRAPGRFDYYLAYFMYNDYRDLANQAANYAASHGSSPRLNKLITTPFPPIRKGDYWIDIKYVLPGRKTVSSTYRHKIFNPVD